MISSDDITAFEADCEVLDRVLERVQSGVTQHREIRAEETLPVLRAAWFWREQAKAACMQILASGQASMECWQDPLRAD